MSAYSIQCPNCAAPLDILGGRRTESVTCKYCGSVIDLKNHYKTLYKFKKLLPPPSPFELGMNGEIEGIEYTIIGMVLYSTGKSLGRGNDHWIDYQLYSPLYGYAWLTYERGNTIFSRRVRGKPSRQIEKLSTGSDFVFNGKKYRFYEQYNSYVLYVQGELSYIARQYDKIVSYDAIDPPYGFSLEKSATESEFYESRYYPAKKIFKAFGIKQKPKEEFHPLKPYSNALLRALSKASLPFFLLALLIAIYISIFLDGNAVKKTGIVGKHSEITFDLGTTSHLVELSIDSDVNNDWIYYDIDILDEKGNSVYSFGKEISYYHGYEGGESWSEGSRSATFYFKLPSTGRYKLVLDAPEYHKEVFSQIEIRENVIRPYYFVLLAVLWLMASVILDRISDPQNQNMETGGGR